MLRPQDTNALQRTCKARGCKSSGKRQVLVQRLLEDGGESAVLLASGGADGTVRVWDISDVAGRGRMFCVHVLEGHKGPVRAVRFPPKTTRTVQPHRLYSGGEDCNVCVWDTDSGARLHVLSGHNRAVLCPRPGTRSAHSARGGQRLCF